ncbi:MAG TPA: DUF3108 domain-containing protein [Terriglobales bacterium]|nr:DUF3108 domain-containing protein [Terriglobales bacterium]
MGPCLRITAIFVLVIAAETTLLIAGSKDEEAKPSNGTVSPAAIAEIRPPAQNYRFPVHQTWVYKAEWHSFSAGTATLRTESSGEFRHAVVNADTAGFVNMLYSVHDRFKTTIDPHTFCSTAITKQTDEGSRKREVELRFDYARGKSVFDERNPKNGNLKHVEHDIPKCVTDLMSGFLYLGSLPLAPGAVYRLPLNDGGPTNNIAAQVENREQVKTPLGSIQAIRIALEPSAGPLKNKGRLWAWYSDDAQHMLVQIRVKVRWGTLTLRLANVQRD